MGVNRSIRVAAAILAFGIFLISTVVAHETILEYQEFRDRPWGILDLLYGIAWKDLPPAPQWSCSPAVILAPDREVTVQPITVGRPSPVDNAFWSAELALRLPLQFRLAPTMTVSDADAAWAFARQNPNVVVLAFTHTYYRGHVLNERLGGWSCANLALVDQDISCPQRIAAHEIGHVLGLDHVASGLMRAKAIACGDRLLPQQSQWLLEQFPLTPTTAALPGAPRGNTQDDTQTPLPTSP